MDLGIAAVAAVIAYTVKGMCGFANTLIFMTAMSFFSDTAAITPVESVLSLPSSAYITWKNRRELDIRLILPMAALMTAGTVIGTFVLKNASPAALKAAFGVIVILLGAEMLFRDRAKKRKSDRRVLALIGMLAGIMSGLYGVGALVAAYMSRTTDTGASFRGNMCAVFLINDVVRLGLYIAFGVLNAGVFAQALRLAPFMVAGLALGTFLSGKVSEGFMRRAVSVLLIISGISLVLTLA